MRSLRIVFLGTPEFAVPMLDILHHSSHQIAGVVTAPDKPGGRGMQLQQSEVKKYALQAELPLLQPEKLRNEEFLKALQAWNADLFVVVAFRMLPEAVWNMPPLGTVNLHASLLPQYRGAAPINWAIMNGEKETGVSTFLLQHEIDTGKIIFSEKIPIRDDENVGELYAELMQLGKEVLLKTVNAIANGNFPQTPQDHIRDIKHAPKIFKETCSINWNESTAQCYNKVRGLSPYPAAFTKFQDKTLKIFAAQKEYPASNISPGEWQTDGSTYLKFFTADGALNLTDVQLEGKKRMPVNQFLRGWKPN
ncbi:MAG: methionyl-tRNA formyltransferase [Chitinophagales bacterium]